MSAHEKISGQQVYFTSSESMPLVKDGSVDFVMTSPPYWDLKDYGHEKQIGRSSYEDYLERLSKVWDECFKKAKDSGVMVVNVNSRRSKGEFYPLAFDIARSVKGWKLWDVLIWYIPNALPQPNAYMERLFDNKFEYLMVFIKGDSKSYKFHKPRVPQKYIKLDPRAHKKNPKGRCMGNIFRIPAYRPPNIRKQGYHVAAYPEELVALMLETYTDKGDIVLDPFLGSGTTLKVSRVMGRSGIGFELNEEFKPLIKSRINEEWVVPDWSKLDLIISSSSNPLDKAGPRKPKQQNVSSRTSDNGKGPELKFD